MAEPTEKNPFQDNLRDLARQSWELEMLISGAAIFFASELPAIIDRGARVYFLDLAPSESVSSMLLPILVYSFFKSVIWVFLAAFAAHFAIRAFWVSLIGLVAAFPKGIDYGNVPNLTEHSRELLERKVGQAEPVIHRLDRLANQLFAFAFLIGLIGLGASIVYLVVFLIGQTAHFLGYSSGDEKTGMPKWFGWLLWPLMILLLVAPMILKKNARLAERFGPFQARATYFFSWLFVPFFYKQASLLNFTFASNTSRRRFYGGMLIVSIFVMGAVSWAMFEKMLELAGNRSSLLRDHFSSGSGRFGLFENRYSSRIDDEKAIPAHVMLPSEIISEERHLDFFIVVPRWADRRIEQFFPKPKSPDSLRSERRRRLEDSLSIVACQRFFEVSINEKKIKRLDFTFDEQHGAKGLRGFLAVDSAWIGRKNWLTVRVPSAARADSLELFGEVLFWYFPKD